MLRKACGVVVSESARHGREREACTVSCNPNKRFRPACSLDEEVLVAAIPKTTEHRNKWAVKLLEEWKTERDNRHSSQNTAAFD